MRVHLIGQIINWQTEQKMDCCVVVVVVFILIIISTTYLIKNTNKLLLKLNLISFRGTCPIINP